MLIDTHAHVNFKDFKDDADEVIKKSLQNGVFMINVGSQYSTSVRAMEYAEKYAGVYAAVGLHPIHITLTPTLSQRERGMEEREVFDYEKYLELAKDEKVVAIGEVGLDYYYIEKGIDIEEIKKNQKEIFLKEIKLANEVQKPMIIHCRESYEELLEILKNNPVDKKGVIHCFVGGLKTAQEFIKLGFKIGLNGIITYSESYDKLIKNIELKDILLETDCPYLNPKPLPRDGRNEPMNVKYVAEKIAAVKNIGVEEVEKITTDNAKKLFVF